MTRMLPLWLVLLIVPLVACAPSASGSDSTAVSSGQGNRPTPAPLTLSSPDLATSPGCYYVWATRELPELSAQLQAELARLDAGIRASAYAFGEECRQDDGTVSFLAMETDFRVRIPVTSVTDEASLGAWISRATSVVMALPASEFAGTRPGRVEFEFYVNESTGLRLVVEISRYREEAEGLEGASIFQLFRSRP